MNLYTLPYRDNGRRIGFVTININSVTVWPLLWKMDVPRTRNGYSIVNNSWRV